MKFTQELNTILAVSSIWYGLTMASRKCFEFSSRSVTGFNDLHSKCSLNSSSPPGTLSNIALKHTWVMLRSMEMKRV